MHHGQTKSCCALVSQTEPAQTRELEKAQPRLDTSNPSYWHRLVSFDQIAAMVKVGSEQTAAFAGIQRLEAVAQTSHFARLELVSIHRLSNI